MEELLLGISVPAIIADDLLVWGKQGNSWSWCNLWRCHKQKPFEASKSGLGPAYLPDSFPVTYALINVNSIRTNPEGLNCFMLHLRAKNSMISSIVDKSPSTPITRLLRRSITIPAIVKKPLIQGMHLQLYTYDLKLIYKKWESVNSMSQTRCHAPTLMRTISIPRLNGRLTSCPLHKFPLDVRPRIVMQKSTHFITYGWLGKSKNVPPRGWTS